MQRVAVITGGNRGIGLQVATELAELDYRVVLSARDVRKGHKALREVNADNIELVGLDVSQPTNIEAFVGRLKRTHGRCDVLINNAGVMPDKPGVTIRQVNRKLLQDTANTNAYGALRLMQLIIPMMETKGYGRIVNTSSLMGSIMNMGSGHDPAYRLSKTILNVLTVMMAREVDGAVIKINAVHPGWVRTDMGGPAATLTVKEGSKTTMWAATLPADGPHGGFFHQGEAIEW
jgi:NAD(P)-dependent dehydrogenase (short-subunit alcohol dehydrogenase family)